MRVDNLQAETTITEQGERVYSPNNKPSASDIGALPATGKAVDADKLDNKNSSEFVQVDPRRIDDGTFDANAYRGVNKVYKPGSGAKNIPGGSYGTLLTLNNSDTDQQMYFGHGNNRDLWYRTMYGSGSTKTDWVQVYTTAHKPTAADVGAHPTSWKPTWDDVSSKPAQATRWPKWGEISDRPGTMPPSSHTHPWSQITGVPSYATRWPSWGEISGKPGNLLTQTTADTRYMSKNAKPDATTLDGIDSTGFGRAYSSSVSTGGGTWNNTQMKAWLKSKGAFSVPYWVCRCSWSYAGNRILDTGHGKINFAGCVIEVIGSENNCTIRVTTPSTSSGGGYSNAEFIFVDNGSGYSPGWRRQYNSARKPSTSELGVYSKSESDSRYMGKNGGTFSGDLVSSSRDNGLFGVYDSKRTDQIWSMGTAYRNHSSGTNFGNLYGLAYKHTNNPTGGTMAAGHQAVWCENGVPKAAMGSAGLWASQAVYIGSSRHTAWHNGNKPSPATIGAEPKLAGDRKRKISYGTGNPSGGSDGDVYIQYK